MKATRSMSLALGMASMLLAATTHAGVGTPPQPLMPWLNVGQSGGFSLIGLPTPGQMPFNPYLNVGQSGGFSLIGMPTPGQFNPYLNIGQSGGFSLIGMPGANGQVVPVQNAGGNGGFVAVPPPPAPPQPVLCKLRDQVLIAGAVESCEKAGGKPVAPEAAGK